MASDRTEKLGDVRKVRVASDGLNQCLRFSKSVGETPRRWKADAKGCLVISLSLFSPLFTLFVFKKHCSHVSRSKESEPSLFHITQERQLRCPLSISAFNPKTPPTRPSLRSLAHAYGDAKCLIISSVAKLCGLHAICQKSFKMHNLLKQNLSGTTSMYMVAKTCKVCTGKYTLSRCYE